MTASDMSTYALKPAEALVAGGAAEAVRNFRLILYCSQRLRNLLDERLRRSGLTVQQGMMLSIVRGRGRPRLGEVAAAMATSHQNAKQIALVLERKRMLRIVPDADDGRMRRLVPTAAGRRGWTDRDSGDFAAIGAMFAGLPRAEQKALRSLLERLALSIALGASHTPSS